jgi:hypothetical protein
MLKEVSKQVSNLGFQFYGKFFVLALKIDYQ